MNDRKAYLERKKTRLLGFAIPIREYEQLSMPDFTNFLFLEAVKLSYHSAFEKLISSVLPTLLKIPYNIFIWHKFYGQNYIVSKLKVE
jgi:hypothetical protein